MSLILFLSSVFVISLSGSMVPGPVTAVLISKSHKNKFAGSYLILGHALIEIPIILLIGFGLASFLNSPVIKIIISSLGGAMIIQMGYSLIKNRNKKLRDETPSSKGIVLNGLISSLNPYFFIWWITAGTVMVFQALSFGIIAFILFIITHLFSDILWYQILSYTIFKTNHFWSVKTQSVIFITCGIVLILFGLYFFISIRNFI